MSREMNTSEVFRTTSKIIALRNNCEAQFLFKPYERTGYTAGKYGWNYDVYDINGIRFLWGDREPDGYDNFSAKILNKLGNQARALGNDYDGIKKLMDEFCESIEHGIKDPHEIKSVVGFKKELVDQKRQNPDKPLIQVAKELNGYYQNWQVRDKVNDFLKNTIEKTGLSKSEKTQEGQISNALDFIYQKEVNKTKVLEKSKSDDYGRGI